MVEGRRAPVIWVSDMSRDISNVAARRKVAARLRNVQLASRDRADALRLRTAPLRLNRPGASGAVPGCNFHYFPGIRSYKPVANSFVCGKMREFYSCKLIAGQVDK